MGLNFYYMEQTTNELIKQIEELQQQLGFMNLFHLTDENEFNKAYKEAFSILSDLSSYFGNI